ncbi:hypothetical protein [Paenibacillus sp. KN14-4R]|uniref:hypothetical protein n=1 Tax=Paenibacillus sp. KN14-4R TaxID=3445773 RepID=UPI003FA083ED
MKKRIGLQITHLALTTTLVFTLAVPSAWASSEGSAPNLITEVASLAGQDSVSFVLKNIRLLPQKGNSTVAFTVTVKNDSSGSIVLSDYMARLKDASGKTYLTRIAPQDKTKRRLAANATQDITYYAQADGKVNLNGLSVEIIKWDFSKPKYEASQGALTVPENFTGVAADGGSEAVFIGDTMIQMSVSKFHMVKSGESYISNLFIDLDNRGHAAVIPPEYQFFIRTKDGSTYPISRRDELQSINPNTTVKWRLAGLIPASVSLEGWQLLVAEHSEAAKLNVPIAAFELAGVEQSAEGTDKQLMFCTNSGMYKGEQGSMYRVPWEDQDVITTNVTIYNDDKNHSLPVPKLEAYYVLDGKAKVKVNVIQTSRTLEIAPEGSETLQVVGKIPIDQQFKTIKLVLQEKASSAVDAKSVDVLAFSDRSGLPRIPFYRAGDIYKTTKNGLSVRHASYVVNAVNRYMGTHSEIFAAQVEVENLEKRPTNLSQIVAYLRTEEGEVFPTQVSVAKGKVGPRGKAILEIWSEIPLGYITSSLHLVLGDAVTGDKLTEGEAVADSYINPVGMWLPDEKTAVAKDIKQVDIYPYTIKFNNLDTGSKVHDFSFKLDYEIAKSKLAQVSTEGHNLVISIEDESRFNFFEKSYNVNEFDSPASSGKDGGSVMKVGKGQLSFTIPNTSTFMNEDTYKSGTIKIYDEFQGKRKLLATQKITLFSIIEKKGNN